MSKIYQGNFQSLCGLAKLFLDTWGVIFTEKERNRWRNFLPALKMQFWPILLKYQEINVQIQTFTDES